MKKLRVFISLVLVFVVVAALLCSGEMFRADAASGAITVKNALNNSEVVYNGDDLQAALQAATRGCIVSFDRFYELQSDVIIDCEVMLTNMDRITGWNGYKLLFTGNGAVYVDNRLARKNYAPLYSYSTVKVTEESGGYVYHLEAGVPTFAVEEAATQVQLGSGIYGSTVDEATGVILLDTSVSGISEDSLSGQMNVPAGNAEKVTISYENSYGVIATGTTLVASASNYDYSGSVTKSYKLVVLGDVNGNGRGDSADAYMIMCYAAGSVSLSAEELQAADVNRDGIVSTEDADALCRKYIRRDSYFSPLG